MTVHLLLAAIAVSGSLAYAQGSTDDFRCKEVPVESWAHLESSINALQSQLQQSESTLEDKTSPEQPKVRKLKEELLQRLEQQQCSLQTADQLTEKSPFSASQAIKLPVLFVTDRTHNINTAPDFYSATRSPAGLEYGSTSVSLNVKGSVRTSLIAGTKRIPPPADSGKGQLTQPEILSAAEFDERLSNIKKKQQQSPLRVVLFVHGFNVRFYEAALSTARLATSMQVPLVPIFYSWPSQGNVLGYWHDEDTVPGSVVRFTPFLQHILSGPADEVVIICHSMGARIVTRSLGELSRMGTATDRLHKVVFAAADVSVDEFSEEWPALRGLTGPLWTSYESSGDYALRLSRVVHHYARVGDSDKRLFVQGGINSIDASSTTTIFRTLGHSYVIDSPVIGADIGDWVAENLPPEERGLTREAQGADIYWKFP